MRSKPRDEKGAIAPFVGLLIIILIGSASFAVDLGYQRVAARDMQAVADLVAMDMARELDGRSTLDIQDAEGVQDPGWIKALEESLARNQKTAVGEKLTPVVCQHDATGVPGSNICATPGIYEDGAFRTTGDESATHVRVITQTHVDFFFPVYADGGWVTKIAYSESVKTGCFKLGSYAAGLNGGDSGLLKMLDVITGDILDLSSLQLEAAGYHGLADVDVTLGELLAANNLNIGSVDQLLNADLTAAQFIDLIAGALDNEEILLVVNALDLIKPEIPSGRNISLGKLMNIDAGDGLALGAELNVLDLISSGIMIANDENLIRLDSLKADLGFTTLNAELHVIQKPQTACGRIGRTIAETSQLKLDLTGRVGIPGVASTDVSIELELAPAKGELTAVECDPYMMDVTVSGGGVLESTIDVGLKVLGGNLIGVQLALANPNYSDPTVSLTIPPNDVTPQSPGGGVLLPDVKPTLTGGIVNLLKFLGLGFLVEALPADLLSTVIRPLNEVLLGPLFNLLGVNVAGADVYAVPREAKCSGLALRG